MSRTTTVESRSASKRYPKLKPIKARRQNRGLLDGFGSSSYCEGIFNFNGILNICFILISGVVDFNALLEFFDFIVNSNFQFVSKIIFSVLLALFKYLLSKKITTAFDIRYHFPRIFRVFDFSLISEPSRPTHLELLTTQSFNF